MLRVTITLSLLIICTSIAAQQSRLVSTTIPQSNPKFNIVVEYRNDFKPHCKTPITYIIHKTGTFEQNTKLEWNYTYVPCNGTETKREKAVLYVAKGTNAFDKKILIRAENLKSTYENGSFRVIPVPDPQFMVVGPADSILEGTSFKLRVICPKSESIKWIWYNGNKLIKGENKDELIQQLSNSSVYYVRAEMEEKFLSAPKEFIVKIKKLPAPPDDFTLYEQDRTITDLEETTLQIGSSSDQRGLKWVWKVNGEVVHEGLSYRVSPKVTTRYTVHSELNNKESIYKTFTVRVRQLPPPPSGFSIAGPKSITEGASTELTINNKGSQEGVKWIWMDTNTGVITEGERLSITPTQRTGYSLYADLNGKRSGKVYWTVDVVQLAKAPTIVGNLKRCISSEVATRVSLQGGKLGTGSKSWSWYEGTYGSGKLIYTGNEIAVKPVRTTSYYVQPDNNTTVYKAFTIEVGQIPSLPNDLVGPTTVCAGEPFTLQAAGTQPAGVEWNWYASDANYSMNTYQGEGKQLAVKQVTRSTIFMVVAKNEYCESNGSKRVLVSVKEQSVLAGIQPVERKGRRYKLVVSGGRLREGSEWVWYKENCGGELLGRGDTLKFRAAVGDNNKYVRAEGNCDKMECKSSMITYNKPPKSKFWFINFGLASNKKQDIITDYTAQFVVGTNWMYIKARMPLVKLVEKNNTEDAYIESNYKTDDNRITNFPTNSSVYYFYNGKVYDETTSYSAGLMVGGKVLKVYFGGGYGKRDLYWGAEVRDYATGSFAYRARARHTEQSVSGLMGEAGFFLKMGSVNLMGGMGLIKGSGSKMYRDMNVGIGFNFKRK